MSFEFSFASQLKTFGAGRWSLFKKKFPAKFSHLEGRMLLPFPASSAFSKGDLCCKKQLLEVISGEDPFFFCLTNQPFCAVWVQWRVTWNLQESYLNPWFLCQMYTRLKPDKEVGVGSLPFTLLPLVSPWWFTTLSCARCEALVFFNHRFHPSGGEMRLPNMSLLLSTRFLLESVMELHFFMSPFKILCALKKKIIWHLPGISVLVTRVWLEFWTPECPSLWPSEVQFIFHKMSLITHWYK